ncbi:hypothetical protein [Sulfurimonas sp. NW9]|uniref:hypothetical protein n=1 Tax=Sulfurimonas sp. NW9 TaxID=2922728 RepID=UPI003DA89DBD
MKAHILSAAISVLIAIMLFYTIYLPVITEKKSEVNFMKKEFEKADLLQTHQE